MTEATRSRIEETVHKSPVVLFMKGNKLLPMCGFSATVVQMLEHLGARYETIDVLEDPEVREGIKEYSSWPTIPQLYVRGEFVGGCGIVREMFQNGELQSLLEHVPASV